MFTLIAALFVSVCVSVCSGSGAVSVRAGGSPRYHVLLHAASGTNRHTDVIKTFNLSSPLITIQSVSHV